MSDVDEFHVYEVYDADAIDCTVFRHTQTKMLNDHLELLLDALEDGASVTITHRLYTQQQLDELYDEL